MPQDETNPIGTFLQLEGSLVYCSSTRTLKVPMRVEPSFTVLKVFLEKHSTFRHIRGWVYLISRVSASGDKGEEDNGG